MLIDANVLISATVFGERTALAREVLDKVVQCFAPSYWHYEFAQVVGAEVRNRRLSQERAIEAYTVAVSIIDVELAQQPGSIYLTTSVRLNISSYDAVYAHHAEQLNTQIVTFDAKLTRAIPHLAISPEAYLAAR